jgi:hypothetical protein
MIFVITHEDVVLPADMVATVYSRNSLALKGILALNAGHIDPGFEGPIVVRLINLRATPWTLTLGEPIFTIVFQTLSFQPGDVLGSHPAYTRDSTLLRVRETADQALANALLDVYGEKLGGEFVRRDQLAAEIWRLVVKRALAAIVIVAAVVAFLAAIAQILSLFDVGPSVRELLRSFGRGGATPGI